MRAPVERGLDVLITFQAKGQRLKTRTPTPRSLFCSRFLAPKWRQVCTIHFRRGHPATTHD